MELTGQIIDILPIRQGVSQTTGKPWQTQSYVIQTQEQYPKSMCFDVFGEDKIRQFNIQKGEIVTVCFDIRAKQYQTRWFNSIECYSLKRGGMTVSPNQQQSQYQPQPAYQNAGQPQYQAAPTQYPPTAQQGFVPNTNDEPLPF